jgi:hypothetical protein
MARFAAPTISYVADQSVGEKNDKDESNQASASQQNLD